MGGFARAGTVPVAAYDKAQPDPVAGACDDLIARWNAAAPQAPVAWVRHYVGVRSSWPARATPCSSVALLQRAMPRRAMRLGCALRGQLQRAALLRGGRSACEGAV